MYKWELLDFFRMSECQNLFWFRHIYSVGQSDFRFGLFFFNVYIFMNTFIYTYILMILWTSPTGQRCVRAMSQRVMIMWHMYGETDGRGQTDGWKDSQNMLLDHLFQCRISPWPKTAEKRVFCTCVKDRRTDRPTDGPTDGQTLL